MPTRALLVDDSRSVLDFLKRLIESDGVEVEAFIDPLEALDAAREKSFDIALVDYEMPHLDGISLIRELRALPRFCDVPIAMVTSIDDEAVRILALEAGATDFLPKRPQATELSVRIRNLIKLGSAMSRLNNQAEILAEEIATATRKLQEREEEIILRLALAVEYRDNDTGEHTLRVARYSRLIAEELGLDAKFCKDLYLAAPLHDVGKVAIPDQILLKPSRLDETEMATIRTHTTIGAQILANSSCELIQLAQIIADAHHEKWDGSGYPGGLCGRQIPLAARIVSVADVFDALTTERPYKKAFPLEEARKYLESKKSKEFDPDCVDAFLFRWDDVVEISQSKMFAASSGTAPQLAPA
jgi:putative two-component system response regulator